MDYFEIFSPRGVGLLFPSKEGRPLSTFALSQLVVKLIFDPETKVKVHDIRKYTSSLASMKRKAIMDLLHSMNWKSSFAFYRHYLFLSTSPCHDVAVPGGRIGGADWYAVADGDADAVDADAADAVAYSDVSEFSEEFYESKVRRSSDLFRNK